MKGLVIAAVALGVVAGVAVGVVAPALGGEFARGDINCSGQVDPVDSLYILRYDAGLATNLPVGCPPIGPTPTVPVTPTPSPTPEPNELPPPQDLGDVSAGGKAQVTISNDAPHALTITFDGPEQREVHMNACATCTEYFFPPFSCPEKGPQEIVTLAPGTYTVRVETDDPGIDPFQGDWMLEGDHGYFECFIIVKSFGAAEADIKTR
jgi:hypothetical protein